MSENLQPVEEQTEVKESVQKSFEEMTDEEAFEASLSSLQSETETGNVEEVEINPLDMVEEENNEDNNKDNNKGIKTNDDKYTIRVDENHHLVIEDSDGNKQVIDDKNEYTMTTNQDGTVTIQNQNGEKVSVDSDGTIKAGENTIAKMEKDGTVKNVSPKNATWVVIMVILVVLGSIGMAAVIVRKKKRSGK